MCEKAPCSVCPNGVPKRELNKHRLAFAACLMFLSFCLRLYLFALYVQPRAADYQRAPGFRPASL